MDTWLRIEVSGSMCPQNVAFVSAGVRRKDLMGRIGSQLFYSSSPFSGPSVWEYGLRDRSGIYTQRRSDTVAESP